MQQLLKNRQTASVLVQRRTVLGSLRDVILTLVKHKTLKLPEI